MPLHRLPLTALTTLALAAFACDAQTTPDYPGPTLLAVSGSVTGDVPAAVVPALAFLHQPSDTLYLMDLDVQGQFPSGFSLRVFDPPPATSLVDGGATFGAPAVTASIVALTTKHPASIVNPSQNVVKQCGDPAGACVSDTTYTSRSSGDVVYHEVSTCDLNWQNCVTASTGDPSAAHPLDPYLRGVVSNYQVVYFAAAVSANTLQGWLLGPQSAGYHVLAVRTATDAEVAAARTCSDAATTQALATFNASHGTRYTSSDLTTDADTNELQRDWLDAAVLLDCPKNSNEVITVVPDGVDHPVTMELVNDPSLLDHSHLSLP